nr:MAG TPA: hypothetical protein [Caudoviricetes sp.]
MSIIIGKINTRFRIAKTISQNTFKSFSPIYIIHLYNY